MFLLIFKATIQFSLTCYPISQDNPTPNRMSLQSSILWNWVRIWLIGKRLGGFASRNPFFIRKCTHLTNRRRKFEQRRQKNQQIERSRKNWITLGKLAKLVSYYNCNKQELLLNFLKWNKKHKTLFFKSISIQYHTTFRLI